MFIVSHGKPQQINAAGRTVPSSGFLPPLPVPGLPNIRYLAPHPWAVQMLGRNRPFVDYEALVSSIPILFACVTRLCFWTARIPFNVYQGEFSDQRQPDRTSDLARLIRKPNRNMRWNRYMRDWMAYDYYVWGNSVAVKQRPSPGAPPDELLPIPWKWIFPVLDAGERIIAYQVWLGATSPVGGGEYVTLTPDQVVHHRWPKGIAPITALSRSLGIEDAALTFQAESLHNGVMPRQAFSTDKVLQKSDFARLREELEKLYAGPEAGGRAAIFDHDLKPAGVVGTTVADVQLAAQRSLTQHDVAGAFDVGMPFLGAMEGATRADLPTLRTYQFQDSLGPKIDAFQADMLDQLVDLEPVWADKDMFLLPDMDAVLLPDPLTLAQIELTEQQSSTTTTDERRRRRGLPPDGSDEAQRVMVPLNMRPIDSEPPVAEGAERPGPGGAGIAAPKPNEQQPQAALIGAILERGNGNGHQGDDDEVV